MQWVARVAMKKKQEPKNVSFHIVMSSANGIRKINVLNYGIFLMEENMLANISACFQFLTGQKWMFGNIFIRNKLRCQAFIFLIKEKYLSVMAFGMLNQNLYKTNRMKLSKNAWFVSEPLAILPVPVRCFQKQLA